VNAASHSHPDEAALTIGCPACIARVKSDQFAAELAELPERDLVVRYKAKVVTTGVATLTTSVFPGETPNDVYDRCFDEIGRMVADATDTGGDDWDFEVDDVSFASESAVA
jgi:hypothetical protein